MPSVNAIRVQLIQNGFCIFPEVLYPKMVEALRHETNIILDATTEEQRKKSGGQGSIVGLPYFPSVFSDASTGGRFGGKG